MEAAGIEETRDEKNLFAARVVISHRLDFFRSRFLPLPSGSVCYRQEPRPRGTYAEHETGLHFVYRAWTLLQKRKNELFEIEINNVNFTFFSLLLEDEIGQEQKFGGQVGRQEQPWRPNHLDAASAFFWQLPWPKAELLFRR